MTPPAFAKAPAGEVSQAMTVTERFLRHAKSRNGYISHAARPEP
jgi:hypothetical protein